MTPTIPESKRLLVLEKIIERGKQTFVDVGTALAEIKENKLYEIEHSSFEDYCRERWGWEKAYWYRIIQSAKAVKSLPDSVSSMVENPRQAAAIAAVPEQKRAAILETATARAESECRPMTARDISEAAECDQLDTPEECHQLETPETSPNGQQVEVVDEIQCCIEDLRVALDKLKEPVIDKETIKAVAEELTKTARMLHRLSK